MNVSLAFNCIYDTCLVATCRYCEYSMDIFATYSLYGCRFEGSIPRRTWFQLFSVYLKFPVESRLSFNLSYLSQIRSKHSVLFCIDYTYLLVKYFSLNLILKIFFHIIQIVLTSVFCSESSI